MKKIELNSFPGFTEIIKESNLISYPRMLLAPRIRSVVLYTSGHVIGVAFRDDQGQLYEIVTRYAAWDHEENEQNRKIIFDLYDFIIEEDQSVTAEKLAKDCENAIESTPEAAALLNNVKNLAGPEDFYGFFGDHASAFWLWKGNSKELHILGREEVTVLNLSEDDPLPKRDYPLNLILFCLGSGCKISRLVIHEGIRSFNLVFQHDNDIITYNRAPLLKYSWGFEIGELVLPSSLTDMPLIMGTVDRMKVPPTLSHINLAELWVDSGGHFDPVTYAVRKLSLPSQILIDVSGEEDNYEGALPLLEPVENWEEVILYGEKPIQDLDPWCRSNIFFCDLIIRYPASWDEGAKETFADRLVDYVREKEPMYGEMRGMDAEWIDWDEEHYQDLAARIIPYKYNDEQSSSQ